LKNKQDVRIAVLGLGHVGLPTALGMAEVGWTVIGADEYRDKAERIQSGDPTFYEPGLEELLKKHLDSGRFIVRKDVASAVKDSNVIFVCVGTPQKDDGAADLSHMEKVARTIAPNLNEYKVIIEKSTTPVQTAGRLKQSIIRYAAARSNGNGGSVDFDVAVNPEFLREGTAIYDVFNPDRIVIGVESEPAAKMMMDVYRPLVERIGKSMDSTIIVTDINAAEIIKHGSNAFLSMKISFANMVADLCEATGANIQDVTRGIGMDPRIGPRFLNAGIGYGGYCFPKDIRAFTYVASEHGVDFSLLREVEKINNARVGKFAAKVRQALWVVKGKNIAVWGLAFKPGTDDTREAPALAVVRALIEEGAHLRLHDPQANKEAMRDIPANPPSVVYCDSAEDAAAGADAVVLLTEWKDYLGVDLAKLRPAMEVPLIIDGRNLFDPAKVRGAGFEYYSVGRP